MNNKMYKELKVMVLIVIAVAFVGILFSLVQFSGAKKDIEVKNEMKVIAGQSYEGYMIDEEDHYNVYRMMPVVRGIYVSGNMAGYRINPYIDLANKTEINSFVIDVKDDNGRLSFKTDDETLKSYGVNERLSIRNIHSVMDKLRENGVYPIARVVAFKDDTIKDSKSEWMLKYKSGEFFKTREPGGSKTTWMNPYNRETWDYIVKMAKEAGKVGFKEIQFDYVRFHEQTRGKDIAYGFDSAEKSKTEIIAEFIEYAKEELHKERLFVAADVFGAIMTSKVDAATIGQDYDMVTDHVDAICPMVYPSHYAKGSFGIKKHPDLEPYRTIAGAMDASKSIIGGKPGKAVVRPWIQGFTAKYIGVGNYRVYGKEEIRAQIRAIYDAGYSEWLIWNPSNRYNADHYLKN
ncbi:MAG: putative glycoside hydrolase [Clostridia bacterium]|jgi:hypothetical protein|nr:putative glycoside hydrolase [Clostridia bacterium]